MNSDATQQKVSVIIPTYNRADYLVQSLESVLGQTYKNMEVIVVNDGSTDDTEERLKPFEDQILYLEKANGGKSSAVNLGLRYVTGEYVWIFDDDDIAFPEKIENHMAIFEKHPEIGFNYTGYETFEGDDIDNIVETEEAFVPPEEEMLTRILAESFICSITVVARKVCYDRVGHYDERLIRFPDYDMCVRFIRAGFRAGVIKRPMVKVRRHRGMRGSVKDRFDVSVLREKQLWYERIIVQKFYWELPVEAYLTDLAKSPEDPRLRLKALLRRAWITAGPMLVQETMCDLQLIQDHLTQNPDLTLVETEQEFLSALSAYASQKEHPEITELADWIRKCTEARI